MIHLYKAEVIRHQRPWKNLEEVEFATLEWIGWFSKVRLLETLGFVSPAEFEAACCAHAVATEEKEGVKLESLVKGGGGSPIAPGVQLSVSVKWKVKRGWRTSQRLMGGVLCVEESSTITCASNSAGTLHSEERESGGTPRHGAARSGR